ncbi:uncharacterized protein MCYG_01806 [Microsporum canis CBS 113480]|uniref:Uncharacterized protein n=1 Tax=Arthroderma otae (strain ATCC MYA-4605 / CBS 113480) TaxID=554155 RepID=C5FI07_ARTOC|nr:uncharacterized protein MCYG_01806 [Microsporum canis CBS 113480]EEQ28987.1 predicted protein [Microsporum canis CBS 113480]
MKITAVEAQPIRLPARILRIRHVDFQMRISIPQDNGSSLIARTHSSNPRLRLFPPWYALAICICMPLSICLMERQYGVHGKTLWRDDLTPGDPEEKLARGLQTSDIVFDKCERIFGNKAGTRSPQKLRRRTMQ